mmetsp:Transcript_2393/g.2870  ORF Transcript_2393/g.2870 Transcript_2393/m.2870 type:complete len:335 (+) Transcript_2393:50-1054(+)
MPPYSTNNMLTTFGVFIGFISVLVSAIDAVPKTGSWQNCTTSPTDTFIDGNFEHPDSDSITISCTRIHYRVPKISLNSIIESNEQIVVGVLSGAGGEGPSKRKSIRSTWAYRRSNVFFLVAGPWENIKDEYSRHGDLLWIDKDEIYVTETSVLTFKTESFVNVMYNQIMKKNGAVSYLFKADDDSYVDLHGLYNALLTETWEIPLNYWGKCNEGGWKPHRDESNKWYLSFEIYPEPEFAPFCQGAGIALSRKFLDCAVGAGHLSHIRYQPNEDVALGLLAERCDIHPTHDDRVWIRYYGEPTMEGKIVQHYVKTEDDMRIHHYSVTGVKGPRLL